MKIWDLSIRQPVFMTMILLTGVILGTISFFTMPVNLFPEVEFPVLVVVTVYPGASPEEVEDQVTTRLEEDLSGIGGIDSLTSQSSEGVSTVILQFELDQSVDSVSQEVREKIGLLRNQLPSGIQEPVVRRFNPADNPIMLFGISDQSGQLSPLALRQLVEDEVQAPLERVDGVAAAEVDGGRVREVKVNLDMQALQARQISPQQVVGALQTENLNIPGGTVTEGAQELLVRTPGNFQTLEDVENVIISRRGSPVYLSDVADVEDGFEEIDTVTLLNGEESIVVRIRKRSGTNTAAVSNAVKDALDPIREANPNLDIAIAGDEALVVEQSTNGAIEDVIWGALLAGLVIFFFFRDIRNTIITIIGLPVIMISTLFFMDTIGISLNNLSLLALALVVGLVIDDGIVVRENIIRWIERGYTPREAASKGTAEVIVPVIATSATILAVFVPVAYAEGIIGQFFRDFGLTVSLAIIVSTFEALTMAPMLSAYFFKESDNEERTHHDDIEDEAAGRGWLDRLYAGVLNWTLDHKIITSFLAVAVIAGSLFSAQFIQTAFLPNLDEGRFDVGMELPSGVPLAVTIQEATQVESIIRSHPNVEDIFTTIGGASSPERANFFVTVVDDGSKEPSRRVMDELRGPLANVPGVSFQLSDGPTGGDVLLGGKEIIVELVATQGTYAELGAEAERLGAELAQIPGVVDLDLSYKVGKPEAQLAVDRERASQMGLTTAQIGSTVRTLLNGEVASTFRGEGTEADIRVQLDEGDRADLDDVLNINLVSQTGQTVPLRNVAEVNNATGPNVIVRIDREPTVSIGANSSGRALPSVTADVTAALAAYQFPEGVEGKMGGDAEVQAESFRNLGLAMLLSIVFIYMVLASQFGSFIQPFLIMLAMPLAIIGAILALALTNRPLDLTAFIGFIMLMGLVTKNSILLVEFANRRRRAGIAADLAIRQAGPIRLRPILMTALSMILAMIPVAAGFSAGGEFRQSMAITIMGGMVTSTFLTLLVVPIAYSIVVGNLDRLSARSARRKAEKKEAQLLERQRRREEEQAATPTDGGIQPAGD